MLLLKHKKMSYSENIVNDLKTSKPSQWYSKIKRMTNRNREIDNFYIEEFSGLGSKEQANKFVQFYAKTRNQFKAVQKDEFSEYFESDARQDLSDILTTPGQVERIIRSMNTKSACVPGDIPFKVMHYFAHDISVPLSNIFNTMFTEGGYREMWKTESIIPIPKNYN